MKETNDAKRENRDLDLYQVGRVSVLFRSDKVLLDRPRRDESVEDVDGTGLFCQPVCNTVAQVNIPCRWFRIHGHPQMAVDRQRLLYIYR